jgi:hypothetical protein
MRQPKTHRTIVPMNKDQESRYYYYAPLRALSCLKGRFGIRFRGISILFSVYILALSACNLPGPTSGASLEEQAATVVAMTLSAQAPRTTKTANPENTPAAGSTSTPTATLTPTYSVPMLKVNESTNCRSGPGQVFEILFTFLPGASVEIVGSYTQDGYWIVKMPGSQQTCWIWGEYSTASGSHWTVPSMTPPSPPTQSPPGSPNNLRYTYFCTLAGEVTTDLSWSDRADNEQGYRVFRNGNLIATLPANATVYSETISININATLSYSVASFNQSGSSPQSTVTFSCN